jgi:hypothetical protein
VLTVRFFKTIKMDRKQKYVRLKQYNGIIIFPCFIEHSKFQNLEIVSAGFCFVDGDLNRVHCFGESYSLGLKSNEKEDSQEATKQVFGIDAMLALLDVTTN